MMLKGHEMRRYDQGENLIIAFEDIWSEICVHIRSFCSSFCGYAIDEGRMRTFHRVDFYEVLQKS